VSWSLANTNVNGAQPVSGGGGVTSLACTFPNSVTAGDFVAVQGSQLACTSGTCSDNKNAGNYTAILTDIVDPNGVVGYLWYSLPAAGGTSFTATTVCTTGSYPSMCIAEFSFTSGATVALDGSAKASGTSAAPASGTVSVAGTDLLLGALVTESSTQPTAGSGFTIAFSNAQIGGDSVAGGLEYKLNVTTGQTVTMSITSSDWGIIGASFSATGGGASYFPRAPFPGIPPALLAT
jgi:hypothetical protein